MSSTYPNPSVALATVVVDELVRGGVKRFALAPGSRSGALARAVADHPETALAVLIDERSACFFAMGAARISRTPTAVITTSGTAAANLFPGVVEADASDIPLILITADRPPELRQTGANQTIDQLKLFGSKVRWFWEAGPVEDRPESNSYWRASTARAVAEARGWGGRPGPVHLNLAFREPTAPTGDDGRSQAAAFGSPTRGRPRDMPWTDTRRAPGPDLSWLPVVEGARRGVVVVGEGVDRSDVYPQLAARLGWPMLAEAMSGLRGPSSISTFHHLLRDSPPALTPDLALCFGKTGLSPNLAGLLSDSSFPQVVIGAPGGWADPNRAASHIVTGSPSTIAQAMLDRLEQRSDSGGWLHRWRQVDQACRSVINDILDHTGQVTEPRIARDLAAMPLDTLVLGSSMPVRAVDWFAEHTPPLVLGNRGASGIDGLISAALGAAWAHPGRMACLTGDLALLHDSNGLIVDERPAGVLVVINNNGGGIFNFLPQARHPHFEKLFGTPHGRDLAHLASMHQLGYRQLEEASELEGAVAHSFAEGGLWLLEARTDREENRRLYERISIETTKAVGPILG